MKTVFVVSPDKISIKRFIQFIMKYLKDFEIGNMHSLMAEESIGMYLKDFCKKYPMRLISYYAKGLKNKEPLSIIPKQIIEMGDLIIWFDLYGTKPIVLKSIEDPHILKGALGDWSKLMTSLNV